MRRHGQAVAAALALTVGVTALFRLALPSLNALSVGFAYLLVVLGVASGWGLPAALAASVAATAQLNFFFLPPVGSLTIQDPQNWVALTVFLATAVVASRLSATAQRRAAEAEAQRNDAARLYDLSRAILLANPQEETADLERALIRIFGLRDARIEVGAVAIASAPEPFNMHWPLRVGQHEVGALHIEGPSLGVATAEAIAGMMAIALERAQLRAEMTRLSALRAGDALKSALLDSFTHELRTPLTSVKAAASALRGQPDMDPEARQELAAVIEEEADRLDGLLENMLDMARIEGGGLQPERRPQSVEPLIRESLARCPCPARRVDLDLAPNLPSVLADGPLTARALAQLLTNADAYSPRAAPIRIAARPEEGGVRLEVRDRGPGFPPAMLPHAFEKFSRAPLARRLRPEGLGMGLAIARGLIEAQGGAVGASNAENGGACVWFTLPAALPHAAQPAPQGAVP
ncbi:MAG: sensor histidine kinase [Terriglobales bacterium]